MRSIYSLTLRPHVMKLCRLVFAYINKHHNSEIIFYPSDPVIDETLFDHRDWSTLEFEITTKDQMPGNMTEARGFGFVMHAFVDADNDG